MRRAGVPSAPGRGTAGVETGRLLGLSWAHLLNDGAGNYLPGVLPAVLASLHEPVQMAGVLVAALTIGQTLQPVVGWVADRLGGRSLAVAGLFLSSLGGGLIGEAHSAPALIGLLLVIGIGSAFFHPQTLAGVRSLLRDNEGFLTAVFLVGGEVGRGIWPTVASLVVANLGLQSLWIVGLPGLATVPLLWRLAPKLAPKARDQVRIRWRPKAAPVALLVSYRCVRAFTTYTLVTFIPILWNLKGGSLVGGASVITTILIVGVVGNLWGGHLADRLGRRPVLVAAAVATAGFVFPVAYLSAPWVWVAAAPLGVAMFLSTSTTVLIGQDIFPENRSMGSGIALGLANGIGALLVLVVGFWVSGASVIVVFWVVAALSLGSALAPLGLPDQLLHVRSRGPC
ncbi:MAG: MFS transporter [Acidimicrobiales bacterium]